MLQAWYVIFKYCYSILLPRIAEYQPTVPTDVLDLLNRSIEQAQAARDASIASIKELKSDFDLP